jgi:peptide/nickel transport system substrate-binding protein
MSEWFSIASSMKRRRSDAQHYADGLKSGWWTLQLSSSPSSGVGPFPSYLALLNRSAIIHRDSYDAEGKVAKIIGTGPFMMDESKPGESYTLVKNPNYWKPGEPLLDGVVLRVITDPVVRLNALRTGEIDMTEELPIADVKTLVETPDPEFTVQVYYINSGERLVMTTAGAV